MKKGLCLWLSCLLLLGTAPVSAQAETYQIGDVTVPYRENTAVRLQQLGLFEGTENGFELESPVTRAQAATMVVRLLGETAQTAENPFTDMQGHWAENAVAFAASQGYVKGTGEGTFEPERGVTGREFATMLLRALGYAAEPNTAYEMSVASQMLLNRYSTAAVKTADYALCRNDLVNICDGALFAKTADGDLLHTLLVEKGVFTKELWSTTMGSATPAATAQDGGFAWNINAQMPQNQNYMFSPLSIKTAFAMAANGADGQTRQEILQVLDISDLDAFNRQTAEQIARYRSQDDVSLHVANALFRNRDKLFGTNFTVDYLQTVETYYGGTAADVTDANAVKTVNGWVSKQTNGKITDAVSSGDFYTLLVNAVYFKGTWAEQFSPGATRNETFTDRDGTQSEIPFMHYTRYMDYYADDNTQMVRLPYRGGDISMYVALTDRPGSYLEDAANNMERARISLSLPKFRVNFSTLLTDIMQSLGVQTAFSATDADFSPMLGGKLLFLENVLHKTYIDVDEYGTEAAAVTAIAAGGTSAPIDEPIEFRADRPFTYFIRDDVSGEILFLGQYACAES